MAALDKPTSDAQPAAWTRISDGYDKYVGGPWSDFNASVGKLITKRIFPLAREMENPILRNLATPAALTNKYANRVAKSIVSLNDLEVRGYGIGNLTKTIVNIFAALVRAAIFVVCVIPAYVIYPIYAGVMAIVDAIRDRVAQPDSAPTDLASGIEI